MPPPRHAALRRLTFLRSHWLPLAPHSAFATSGCRLPRRPEAWTVARKHRIRSVASQASRAPRGAKPAQKPPTAQSRSPRDLVHFRRSRFVAHLNELRRRRMLPPGAKPDAPSPLSLALADAGRAHEQRVVDHVCDLITKTFRLPSPLLHDIPFSHPERHALTQDAISRRVPLIRGAALRNELIDGYADLLILSACNPFMTPSQRQRLDPASYSVCEVKLATNQNSDHTLQAAVYASLLERLLLSLDVKPSPSVYLYLGSPSMNPVHLQSRSLGFLYRKTYANFEKFLTSFAADQLPMPDGPLNDMAPWSEFATKTLEQKDSLQLIAGVRRSQASAIATTTGCSTLKSFAAMPPKEVDSLIRSANLPPSCSTLHKQARLQHEALKSKAPVIPFEFVNMTNNSGIHCASPGDLYFDMEGYPLFHDGGLEYLFGIYSSKGGDFQFWWAHTRQEEEQAFIALMNALREAVEQSIRTGSPSPHVYHYGHYELTALRRISLRCRTDLGLRAACLFESLVDSDVFVDIYKLVRAVLIVGDRSYSIKTIEKLLGVSREGDELADAKSSVAMYYDWRRENFDDPNNPLTSDHKESSHPVLDEILHYNRQDCVSLHRIVEWLREKLPLTKADANAVFLPDAGESPSNDGNPGGMLRPGSCGRSKELKVADSDAICVSESLSETLLRPNIHQAPQSANQALAHLLHFYTRESAPSRRLFRERLVNTAHRAQSSYDDEKCISGMRLSKAFDAESGQKRAFCYTFNSKQPVQFLEGESAAFVLPRVRSRDETEPSDSEAKIACFFSVCAIEFDPKSSSAEVTVSGGVGEDFEPPRQGGLVSCQDLSICDGPLRQSILRRAADFSSVEQNQRTSLAEAFLNRVPLDHERDDWDKWRTKFQSGENPADAVSEFLNSSKESRVFVIQGPPGSGKTYQSSQIIRNLVVENGKTVAVCSNSHSAIDNLLDGVVRAGVPPQHVAKVGTKSVGSEGVCFKQSVKLLSILPISESAENSGEDGRRHGASPPDVPGKKRKSRKAKTCVVGATSYQLCREENEEKFDVVVIDEASQLTMAHFVALSSCAKHALLVGDQQQLEMPIKGAHPDEVKQSCLGYIVGKEHATVPPNRGVFLNTSFRMNPKICSFVSEEFYEGELGAAADCASNVVSIGDGDMPHGVESGEGIHFIACEWKEDEEMTSRFGKWCRPCEVDVIAECVDAVLGKTVTTREGQKTISEKDILVMAPYNAQVRALRERLGEGVRVGTVDKFQGLQAVVALVSTCTSGASDERAGVDEAGGDGDGEEGEEEGAGASKHRSLRFCLRRNRLNVAISRAQCLAIVTGDGGAQDAMRLSSVEDVNMAALYEHVQVAGSPVMIADDR